MYCRSSWPIFHRCKKKQFSLQTKLRRVISLQKQKREINTALHGKKKRRTHTSRSTSCWPHVSQHWPSSIIRFIDKLVGDLFSFFFFCKKANVFNIYNSHLNAAQNTKTCNLEIHQRKCQNTVCPRGSSLRSQLRRLLSHEHESRWEDIYIIILIVNNNPLLEFRQHIHENYPFVLDYYYKIGEIVGDSTVRQADASYWSAEEKRLEETASKMLSNPYFKSVLWLIGFGGMGYGLMVLTEPNVDKLERIKASVSSTKLSADEQRKALFMKKLQEASTTSAPIYRSSSEK